MGDMKKCDRCGAYYNDESSVEKNFKVNGTTVHAFGFIDANDTCYDYYDLCDNCARDLFHWLSEPIA